MTKTRKLYQLIVTIESAYCGISKRKEAFYFLNIQEQTLLGSKKEVIYAFFNLTSKNFWQVLETNAYQGKKYLFACEKRNRGWRLKEVKEL